MTEVEAEPDPIAQSPEGGPEDEELDQAPGENRNGEDFIIK